MKIPSLTVEQMRKVDSLAVNHFGIEIGWMMEHAGKAVAEVARKELKKVRSKKILVLVGKGHNGGDALVAARFLHNWGAKVLHVVASHPDDLSKLTREHNGTLRSMHVIPLYQTDYLKVEESIKHVDLIIDGLIGYNLSGNPRGFYADLINLANNSGKKILAIDNPSGLDSDTGEAKNPCIKADYTVALTLPKKGILKGRNYSGKIYVAEIGIPPELFELMEFEVPNIFEKEGIVKI